MRDSRDATRAVEAIQQEQAEAAETPPSKPSRSLFQRVALGLVVAVAAAGGVIRRRGPKIVG
jgi:ferric-dicitrate binding protein FerR (iron transport regulator)